MSETDQHDRLLQQEADGWREVIDLLDRVPPSHEGSPGAGASDWTVRDLLFHLAAWTDEAAAQLAAIREGRYHDTDIDTDARNEEYLRAGRALDVDAARVRLERARARGLAEWAAVTTLSAPAVEWFGESGPEHYREHVDDLRAFVEAIGAEGRAGAPARRAGIVAAEREAWDELGRTIAGLPPDAFETPGVTPDGWSVKDTMWHVARWWDDFADAVPRFAEPGFDPDDDTPEEIDAMNRGWFEESRRLPLERVRERWTAAREAGVRAFVGMSDPPRTAERWFEECGCIHYEKHLIDLRPWASKAATFGGAGQAPP